jgi:hypothetical protein
VRVDVVEIQICFEFKLICNLQNRFEKEKKKNFFIGNRLQTEFGAAQPASPHARGLLRGLVDSWARTA